MTRALMWFRRDLRLHDNAALYHALVQADATWCCFCFDRDILDLLDDHRDRRVHFIHQSLSELDQELRRHNSRLIVCQGRAVERIPELAARLSVDAVFANHDYEPRCRRRDADVDHALQQRGARLHTFKDHVIFEENEVVTAAGGPFKVYTPYRNAWRRRLQEVGAPPHASARHLARLAPPPDDIQSDPWSLADLGFQPTDLQLAGGTAAGRDLFDDFLTRIQHYDRRRDYPAAGGVSGLSTHLRFGTIGIREVLAEALDHPAAGAAKWVDQLIWRDFYNMILHHFPHTENRAFNPLYDDLPWTNDTGRFGRWCNGMTGYPIVDAGMRELNRTGIMHNRLRMIVASFLTKDLLIDWKWGERYFAARLLDFDLSQNLGGWQWSASVGTDAQPYFRIFNPVAQSQRFDPEGRYIRRYVPEVAAFSDVTVHAPWKAAVDEQRAAGCVIGTDYPAPIVDHAAARHRTLEMFQQRRAAGSAPRRGICD